MTTNNEIPRDLLGKIVDEVFDGAVEDTGAIEDIYRVIVQELQPAMPADAWQPIDTAPKYTEVLVWREDSGPFIAKFTDPYEVISVEEMEREGLEFPDDFEEWWSDAYGWQEGDERPTHWMPLPAGPDARHRIEVGL